MIKLFSLAACTILFLSSCSLHEEIDLSEEGKGFYKMGVDMGTALEMMKSMGGSEQIPDSVANKVLDSSFSMRSQIDSAGTNFTDTEKSFFYLGTMNMKVNMKENKMKIDLKYPIANTNQLQQFFAVYAKVDSVSKLKQKENPISEKKPTDMGLSPDLFSSMPANNKPYIITDSSIERKVVAKEEITQQMGDMKGAEMFMGQMTYTVTIKLPRPVKLLEGKNIKLLPDKKSVFYSVGFSDMLAHPEEQQFRIVF